MDLLKPLMKEYRKNKIGEIESNMKKQLVALAWRKLIDEHIKIKEVGGKFFAK